MIFKIIWREKINLYFDIYFLQKQTKISVGGPQGDSCPAKIAKFLLHVQPTLNMIHPRRLGLPIQRSPSWDAVTKLTRP